MSGTFEIVEAPGASSVAAMSLRTEFFAPRTVTSPRSTVGPSMTKTC